MLKSNNFENHMIQGSNEWHELRKNMIGASMAPIIMGVSPWKTKEQLWQEMVGLKEPSASNFAQERGLALELSARKYFYVMTGHEVHPKVMISKRHEWMMASMDGVTEDHSVAVEIKCPGKSDHNRALSGNIPDKYYPQLQHQMEVMDLNMIYYLSFDGEEGVILRCERDQAYIDKMIAKEKEFYECIQNFIPPQNEKEIQDPQWSTLASQYIEVQTKLKELQNQELNLKNTLVGLSGGKSCQGHGLKLTRYVRKGSVDYERMLKEINVPINIDNYRKEDIEAWKITQV